MHAMQFELADDDRTDDATEPVAPGTSCCGGLGGCLDPW